MNHENANPIVTLSQNRFDGKWGMLGFLCVIFVLYTIDRAMLGLLAVPIQKETGFSNVEFGVLSAAIFWTYALCVPFSGLAGDRFNRAKLIGIAATAWSAMTLLAGFANGFWSLFLLVSVAIVAAVVALFGSWRASFFAFGTIGLVIGANQFTAVFDVVSSQFRAGSIGFLNVIAGLVGSTAPIALGALSESLGIRGFELGFASMAAVQLVAAAALVLAMAFTFRRDPAAIEE